MNEKIEEAYEVLELPPGASFKEVKKSYTFRCMAFHPDRFPAEMKAEAEKEQLKINRAYRIIESFLKNAGTYPSSSAPGKTQSNSYSAPPKDTSRREKPPEDRANSPAERPKTFSKGIFLFFKSPKVVVRLSFILFVIISLFFFLEHQPLKKSKKLHLQFPHNKLSSGALGNQTQMPNTAREQRQILNVVKEYYDLLDKHRYAAAYHLRNPQEDNIYPYNAFYKTWAVNPQNLYIQLQNDQVYSYNINSSVVSVLLKSQDLVQIPFPSLQTAIYRGAVSLIKLNHQWYINTEHIHEVKVIQVKKLSSLSQPFGLSKLHKKIHVSKTTNSQLFIVQVGLFQSLIHADKFHKKLDANGYNSSISRAQINETRVYQVWIGPFHEKKLASDISHALILLGYKNATVRISLAPRQ